MSTTPRIEASSLREAFGLQPDVFAAFTELYGQVWMGGRVDHATKELVRMRNARVNDCGYCRRVRFSQARDEGLDEETIALVEDGWQESALAEPTKVALRFADRFIRDPGPADRAEQADLVATFDPAQQVELALALAMFVGFSKMLISLGLEPDEMPVTVVATPGLQPSAAP